MCISGSKELKCVFLVLRSLNVCVSGSNELKCVFLVLFMISKEIFPHIMTLRLKRVPMRLCGHFFMFTANHTKESY